MKLFIYLSSIISLFHDLIILLKGYIVRFLGLISTGENQQYPAEAKNWKQQRVLLEEFDTYPAHGNPTIANYQNELLHLYGVIEGEENRQHFIGQVFSQRLTQNLTPSIKGKLQERVNTSFYMLSHATKS